jgi:prolyl oligopeptidase
MKPSTSLIAVFSAVLITVAAASLAGPLQYPAARRVEVSDDYHGTRVEDPYRWFESLDSTETKAEIDQWVAAENRTTRNYLDGLPQRAWFERRLDKLLDYERRGIPQFRGGRYAYLRNSGTDQQDQLWVTEDIDQPGRLLVDPAQIRKDGTASIGAFALSRDGRLLIYSVSDGGSDWHTWHVRDVQTGHELPDILAGTKFTHVEWTLDGRAVYYSRYPQKPGGGYDGGQQPAIYRHALGTAQARDVEVFRPTDHPTREAYPHITEDGRYLIIKLVDGYEVSGIYYQDLAKRGSKIVRLIDTWDALYYFLGNRGPTFFLETTLGAPLGRIIAVDLRNPQPASWRTLIPASADGIEQAEFIGNHFVLNYTHDAHARVAVFGPAGEPIRELALPGLGTVDGFPGPSDRTETFFIYTDFMTPRALYRYDVATGEQRAVFKPAAGIDASRYVTEQVFYGSRDGTRIPMYIVHRRDFERDGSAPTALYGYGGFNISLLPGYSASRAAWLEAGGVYAVANLRGGGEYGEKWHKAGTRTQKQNVFDDFIAAAEYLQRERYTSASHLAIWGGSNGGLLVGAVLNQRPELYAAAIPAVGVMDMLRYQTASAEAFGWSSDYGLSSDPVQFKALRAYSPYHTIRAGTCYPPTLVLADANDDRVAAWNSYKYAAALQHAQASVQDCDKPTLVRIETRAGHGFGASREKIVGEYADQWAFVAKATGLKRPGE